MLQNKSMRKRMWKVRDIDNNKEENAITMSVTAWNCSPVLISLAVRLCLTYM
jgi:hypothetical protein